MLLSLTSLLAGQGSENLLLVVNADSQNSLAVANHYIQLRQIPSRNVVYLPSVPSEETIGIVEFKQQILEPILKAIIQRKLVDRIDVIAYSADFPTAVRLPKESSDLIEPEDIRKYFKPVASLNAVTFFAQQVLQDDFSFVRPIANFYYRKDAEEVLRNYYLGEMGKTYAELEKSYSAGDLKTALELAETLIGDGDQPQPVFRFWAARCMAKLDRAEPALEMLERSIDDGWSFSKTTASDPAFKNLREQAEFRELIDRMPEVDSLPVTSFRQKTIWQPTGFPTASPEMGRRYFLSVVLGVARGKGNSVDEIVQALKSSAAADGSRPDGTFYYVSNQEIRTRTRAPLMPVAVESLKRIGQSVEMIDSTLPTGKQDVLGLMMGVARFNWPSSRSKIVPGAICDNLTSFGGAMAGEPGKGQTTVAEFIRHGVAGASGTVIEPFTIPHKFPHPLIHYFYARGCNLAEAFYQSVHGPYQLLIVGDPLCRPFAKLPEFSVTGVTDEQMVTGKIELSIQPEPDSGIVRYDVYLDDRLVKELAVGESITLDTTRVVEGYHEFRIVAHTGGPIEVSKHRLIPFRIRNRGELPRLEEVPERHQPDDALTIRLSSPGDFELLAVQHGRRLSATRIPADSTAEDSLTAGIEVACAELGSGPSEVKVFARRGQVTLCLGSLNTVVEAPQE